MHYLILGLSKLLKLEVNPVDLFSLYVLFSQYRSCTGAYYPRLLSCDNSLRNCFLHVSSYSRAYVRIIHEKTKGEVPLGPLLRKQNKQAIKRSILPVICRLLCG